MFEALRSDAAAWQKDRVNWVAAAMAALADVVLIGVIAAKRTNLGFGTETVLLATFIKKAERSLNGEPSEIRNHLPLLFERTRSSLGPGVRRSHPRLVRLCRVDRFTSDRQRPRE